MDDTTIETPSAAARGASQRRTFLPWLLTTVELVAVAAVSMLLMDTVTSAAIRWLALTWILGHPLGIALVMTLDIWVGVALWMLVRRRPTRMILAVLLSVAAAFLAPLPLYWATVVTASESVLLGHVLVVPALALTVALLPSGRAARRARVLA